MQKLLHIPIWERKLLVVTYPTDVLAAARKHRMGKELIAQIKNDPPDKQTLGMVFFDDLHARYVVWFPSKRVPTDTLIHETNHIVKHMMKVLGAQQEREAHAYTQEYLYREIKKALR